jgi:hypothetical protein
VRTTAPARAQLEIDQQAQPAPKERMTPAWKRTTIGKRNEATSGFVRPFRGPSRSFQNNDGRVQAVAVPKLKRNKPGKFDSLPFTSAKCSKPFLIAHAKVLTSDAGTGAVSDRTPEATVAGRQARVAEVSLSRPSASPKHA